MVMLITEWYKMKLLYHKLDDDFNVSIMTTGSGSTGSVGDVLNTSGTLLIRKVTLYLR